MNVNGYPQYRRRAVLPGETQPRSVKNGQQTVRDIVPYNARLLLEFHCHINVEVCTSIRAVKYLYKYTYKGPDRASLACTRDEIQDFLDARWIAPPEAMWRILQYELHGKSHQVVRLPVHLQNEQVLLFRPGFEQHVVGLLEIFQRPGAGPATQNGYLRFVTQACALAGKFFQEKNHSSGPYSKQKKTILFN